MPELELWSDGCRVMRHRLHGARTIIGRSDTSDLWVNGTYTSRTHAVVELKANQWMIRDRSRHGTLVNGHAIKNAPLHCGDEIRIGDRRFIFRITPEKKLQPITGTLGTKEQLLADSASAPAPKTNRFGDMVGQSKAMRTLFSQLDRIAAVGHTALITGESGTGKELAAHGVHRISDRKHGPFVPVNCAALPNNLIESELFGHEKGAFTGASRRQDGAFQRAHQGTLFLDEIGELSLEAQAKLLRALESGEVRRVGGSSTERPSVRVIAATNRDLLSMVDDGTFREDLYFRIGVLTVRIPPLRERLEDIEPIAHAIIASRLPNTTIDHTALAKLHFHTWPGNVRELRNVLTRASVMGDGHIGESTITFSRRSHSATIPPSEPEQIRHALARADGNKSKAARIMGLPRSSFLYKLHKLEQPSSNASLLPEPGL